MAVTGQNSFCKGTQCKCLFSALDEEEETRHAVARYQMYVDSLDRNQQKMELVNLMQHAQAGNKVYSVPLLETEDKEYIIYELLILHSVWYYCNSWTSIYEHQRVSRRSDGRRSSHWTANEQGNERHYIQVLSHPRLLVYSWH